MENAPKRNLHIPIILGLFFILLGFLFYLTYFRTQPTSFQVQPSATPGITGSNGNNNLVPKTPNANKPVPGQIIVKIKPGVSEDSFTAQVEAQNMQVEKKMPEIQSYVLSVPKGQEDAMRQWLQQSGLVTSTERDYIQSVQMVPNDTDFRNQWGLSNTGQSILGAAGIAGKDVHAEKAWDVTDGTGIKVAVIDTGIDMAHPDLASKVVAQKVFTTNTIDDKLGHGTHVAGIVAAVTNNNQGIAGTCPGCQLLIGKAVGDNGEGQTSTIAQGIMWAADSGAQIINVSSGGEQETQVQKDAIAYAIGKGSLVVAAAGNEGIDGFFYPARTAGVLSVGATSNSDIKSSFSNFGSWVKVTAPGTNIYSTLPTHAFNMQAEADLQTNYDYVSGTSMSAPMVSGVAALVWASQYGGSAAKVTQRLYDTADKITGTGQFFQYGRVNAEAAVGTVQPTPTTAIVATTAPTTGVVPLTDVPVTPTIFPTTPLYCLGSCPTLVMSPTPTSADVTPGEGGTILPTSEEGTPAGEEPTLDPCNPDETITAQHWGGRHHKKHHGWIGDFMQQLLELIKQLLELIGNGGGSNGGGNGGTIEPTTNPEPTIDPCVSPTEEVAPTDPVATSEADLEEQISGEPTTSTAEATATVAPCEDAEISAQHFGRHHKKHQGWIGRFMEKLMEIIKQLIEQIGGNVSEPTEPGTPEPTAVPGGDEPCEPTATEPTVGEEPTEAVEPTEGVEPTTATETTPTTGAGGEAETNATVKITFYGAWDNDPPGSTNIAYPVIHDKAGGTGTYEDPLTFASPAGDGAYEIGTKIYVPFVQKYFIKEDQCAVSWTAPEGCGDVTMVDLYVGNPSDQEAATDCENSLTPGGDTAIVVNPPAGLTVSPEKIWDQATGACMSPKN